VPTDPREAARLVLIGLVGAGLLLVLSYFFEDWFPSFRELKAFVMRFLGPVSAPTAIYLALLTGVGEELLFRGTLQPFAGLVVTSVLFGLLHMGKDGLVSAWSVWALVAGLLLGWMFDETGSLWPPIIAHFVVNAVSIMNLRRAYRGLLGHLDGGGPRAGGSGSSGTDASA
jgi:membrane protease YdiL (CAAX protease family)